MAIFSRRFLQQIIDEIRPSFSEKEIGELIGKLNKRGDFKLNLSAEWEIIILHILLKLGSVDFELRHGGSTTPDITFLSEKYGNFLADIRSVSDAGLDKDNPIEYFHECMRQYFRKMNLSSTGVLIAPESKTSEENYKNRSLKLQLPEKKDMHCFIAKHFSHLISHIKTNPTECYQASIDDMGATIKLSYQPNHLYTTTYYSSYDVPYSLQKNPVYRALKKKGEQLKKSGYDGKKGIFLCDGGCNSLSDEMYSSQTFSVAQIVSEYFKNYSSVSFVIVLSILERHGQWGNPTNLNVLTTAYINPACDKPFATKILSLVSLIREVSLEPVITPSNAVRRIKNKDHNGVSFIGGFFMKGNKEVKISSRMLLEILSGKLDYVDLINKTKQKRPDDHDFQSDWFARQLKAGHMISSVKVEKSDKDDDWIVIEFGAKDAAISDFN